MNYTGIILSIIKIGKTILLIAAIAVVLYQLFSYNNMSYENAILYYGVIIPGVVSFLSFLVALIDITNKTYRVTFLILSSISLLVFCLKLCIYLYALAWTHSL